MPSRTVRLSDKAALPFKTQNKQRRQSLHIKRKQALDVLRRAERFKRKKEEDKNPRLREDRLRRNIPQTLDRKRIYDEVDEEPEDGGLGMAINVERVKRRKLAREQGLLNNEQDAEGKTLTGLDHDAANDDDDLDDDADSMLDADSWTEEDDLEPPIDGEAEDALPTKHQLDTTRARAVSPTRSTASTNLSLAPAALAAKFPTLFLPPDTLRPTPKILLTTSLNSTIHHEAELLSDLFPNTTYIRRTSHRYGHKFSVREISAFASRRDFTALIVLEEDLKKASGLTIVHLPIGPTFHFSIKNWYEGKSLLGHGRPTSHTPELILNNFVTPLGLLTAQLFQSLFPPSPELLGRQVVTLHNQRDFIFFRRHRYVFREKRETEKTVVGADGKELRGVEGIRAGLQELGPRFTLKLRRVDKGIQRGSGQEWEWKGKTDRIRTKFQL